MKSDPLTSQPQKNWSKSSKNFTKVVPHLSYVNYKSPWKNFSTSTALLEMMNVTPTQSEAWDIVQMEEIEREFLDDDEEVK